MPPETPTADLPRAQRQQYQYFTKLGEVLAAPASLLMALLRQILSLYLAVISAAQLSVRPVGTVSNREKSWGYARGEIVEFRLHNCCFAECRIYSCEPHGQGYINYGPRAGSGPWSCLEMFASNMNINLFKPFKNFTEYTWVIIYCGPYVRWNFAEASWGILFSIPGFQGSTGTLFYLATRITLHSKCLALREEV